MSADASVTGRLANLFGLFSERTPVVSIEAIIQGLRISQATAYRYVRDLCDAGLLAKVPGGFLPGPKIIELEYLISRYDPILKAGEDLMQGLSAMTGCDVLLCNVYGDVLVNVYHLPGSRDLGLTFGKGKRMPLFRGSQARAALASMTPRRLRRVFDRHSADADLQRIGATWPEFVEAMRKVRRAGHYISRGELHPEVTGIAAPVFDEDNEVLGSLVLAFATAAPPWTNEQALAQLVMQNAAEISARIGLLEAQLRGEPQTQRLPVPRPAPDTAA